MNRLGEGVQPRIVPLRVDRSDFEACIEDVQTSWEFCGFSFIFQVIDYKRFSYITVLVGMSSSYLFQENVWIKRWDQRKKEK